VLVGAFAGVNSKGREFRSLGSAIASRYCWHRTHFLSPVPQWKQKGNTAFSAGDYDIAIEAYSKAIQLSPENDTYYSNRSAAYLRSGDFDNALADASNCIALNHVNHNGYGRKAAAYHAMRKYDRAIAVYKEGLKVCPCEEHLVQGLHAARRAKAQDSGASKALKRTAMAKRVSKREQAKKCATVSVFVKQTRETLKLKMVEIQAQLDLINDLAAMEDEAKLDLLFSLIDGDGDGTVDAKELAGALRKRKKDLSFQDSIEHAIEMVATFDSDGDAKLNIAEFRECINVMLKELTVSLGEFSEFLVMQIIFAESADTQSDDEEHAITDIDKEVKAREELFDMLSHERMEELFHLFDKDGSGELTFKEVAIGLYQITRNVEESTRTAMNLLLMMDKNDSRTLHYDQFGRLIMAIVATANSTFEEVADDLVRVL
jgi:Ca2+-binding EF-hand superfamily protein